jgi:hypothetical protein
LLSKTAKLLNMEEVVVLVFDFPFFGVETVNQPRGEPGAGD